jgi:hypothetical protein
MLAAPSYRSSSRSSLHEGIADIPAGSELALLLLSNGPVIAELARRNDNNIKPIFTPKDFISFVPQPACRIVYFQNVPKPLWPVSRDPEQIIRI